MIRGRKELRRGGSGKPKPLSLSQEMSLSDLRRAAAQGGLPGESDPFFRAFVLSAPSRWAVMSPSAASKKVTGKLMKDVACRQTNHFSPLKSFER